MIPATTNTLKNEYWVVHHNVLNEALCQHSTVMSNRFVSIYISRLNPNDLSSREVSFTLAEYKQIMEIKCVHSAAFKKSAEDLISIPVSIKNAGRLKVFPLFSEFTLDKNDFGDWMVTINCHDWMIDYLFDLKGNFSRYRLGNILNLKEKNHQEMYKFLNSHQHYKKGVEVTLDELKLALGLKKTQYAHWPEFERGVLVPCQKALAERSDLKFEYDTIQSRQRGAKVIALKIRIKNNKDFKSFEPSDKLETVEDNITGFSIKADEELHKALDSLENCLLNEKQKIVLTKKAKAIANIKYGEEIDNDDLSLAEATAKVIDASVAKVNKANQNSYTSMIPGKQIKNPAAYLHVTMANEFSKLIAKIE